MLSDAQRREVPLPLTPYEAEAAARGELRLIIRPVEPQPKRLPGWSAPGRDGIQFRDKNGPLATWAEDVLPREPWKSPSLQKIIPAQPGDVIVGLEEWRVGAWDEHEEEVFVDYRVDGFARKEGLYVPDSTLFNDLWCESTDDADLAGVTPNEAGVYRWTVGQGPCRWRDAATMPPEFARHRWPVERVECKRLQELTRGMYIPYGTYTLLSHWNAQFPAYPWDGNPWVFLLWLGGE